MFFFFFLSAEQNTCESLWKQGQAQNVPFFPLGITKCNFYLFNVSLRLSWLLGNCLQSISAPITSFCDYQPQVLNRPAVLCGIKVNMESLGKIQKCPWSLKAMGKLIKFQHETLTQFNLMRSGLIVEMSDDYKLMNISNMILWKIFVIGNNFKISFLKDIHIFLSLLHSPLNILL